MHRATRVMCGLAVGLVAGLTAPSPSHAQEERVIEGEVVDPAMYLKDGKHGPDLVEQTYEAVDGGQTLALLDEKAGILYLLVAEEPGEDPNELVYDYVNQKVKVTGKLHERSGVKGLVVVSVQPLEAQPNGAPQAQGSSPPAATPTVGSTATTTK